MIGWMSQGMLDTVAALMAEKVVTTALRAELAAERARVDWFMQHVNELKVERAALYQRIGVFLPVATIQRVGASLPGADDNYIPPEGGKTADLGNLLATARELREKTDKSRTTPPVDLTFQGFDDIGDEAAELIGVKHAEDGTGRVVHTK